MALSIVLNLIKNLTLNIDILASQKLENVEVTEYNEHSIIVNLPPVHVTRGTLLSLEGVLHFHGKNQGFAATGQVESCETNPTGKITRLEIHFRQTDNDLWDRFLKSGKDEQDRVDHLFYTMKGVK